MHASLREVNVEITMHLFFDIEQTKSTKIIKNLQVF